mgnify:CR=1 FL=1
MASWTSRSEACACRCSGWVRGWVGVGRWVYGGGWLQVRGSRPCQVAAAAAAAADAAATTTPPKPPALVSGFRRLTCPHTCCTQPHAATHARHTHAPQCPALPPGRLRWGSGRRPGPSAPRPASDAAGTCGRESEGERGRVRGERRQAGGVAWQACETDRGSRYDELGGGNEFDGGRGNVRWARGQRCALGARLHAVVPQGLKLCHLMPVSYCPANPTTARLQPPSCHQASTASRHRACLPRPFPPSWFKVNPPLLTCRPLTCRTPPRTPHWTAHTAAARACGPAPA